MAAIVKAVLSDITTLHVDAVVNATNESLAGGGGVDGAIHRAAGPDLQAACDTLGGCLTGQAKLTAGFGLPAEYVIHTVGPVWRGGSNNEAALLASCYRNALAVAAEQGMSSIAFPAISCGVFSYPPEQAVAIAVHEVRQFCDNHDSAIEQVLFVCIGEPLYSLYGQALRS